jgi:DNA-binding transcriptional MocR family regulator
VSDVPGFHRWLPLPPGRSLDALVAQAAQAGITLAPPGPSQQVAANSLGIRICLGHPATETQLERALVELRGILENAETFSYV